MKFHALGADPEFFLIKNGKPFSAEGVFGGTKDKPKPLLDLPAGFFIQEDNVAGEFNIPPSGTAIEFSNNIHKALRKIDKLIKHKDLKMEMVSAMHFPLHLLMTEQAQTLGCEPDFNAWEDGAENAKPIPPMTLRTAAGHLHISWNYDPKTQTYNVTDEQRRRLVQMHDIHLVIPSLLITKPTERRTLYGRAGAYRPTKYGVEARCLDNFWLKEDVYRRYIYNTIYNLVNSKLGRNFDLYSVKLDDVGDEVQEIINNHNVHRAMKFMTEHEIMPFPRA